MEKIIGQDSTCDGVSNNLRVFKDSNGRIKPHFFITGPTGTGKTHIVKSYCDSLELDYLEINAASLTNEASSGLSLSRTLTPLLQREGMLTVILVDEFDKPICRKGVANSDPQDEFLKLLENGEASVYTDYGKYERISIDKCMFIFIGTFSGSDMDKGLLLKKGISPELLGRVPIHYKTNHLSYASLLRILLNSELLKAYCHQYNLAKDQQDFVLDAISKNIKHSKYADDIGARGVDYHIHTYFIEHIVSNPAVVDQDVQ